MKNSSIFQAPGLLEQCFNPEMLCEFSLTVGFKADPDIDSIPISSKLLEHCFKNRGWHGGGFARAAHWIIRRPRVAGGRACVDLVSKSLSNSSLSNPSRKGSRGSAARAQMAAAATGATACRSIFRLKFAILALLRHFCPNILPRRFQLDAQITQDKPIYAQLDANIGQHSPS